MGLSLAASYNEVFSVSHPLCPKLHCLYCFYTGDTYLARWSVNVSVDRSVDVSLYLSIPERMVRNSINVHLALMLAWCVRVCVCII